MGKKAKVLSLKSFLPLLEGFRVSLVYSKNKPIESAKASKTSGFFFGRTIFLLLYVAFCVLASTVGAAYYDLDNMTSRLL